MEENLISKNLYKLFIIVLKYTPIVISVCYVLNTILYILEIDFPLLSTMSGMSLITWLFIYISAVVFKFCIYHRMFLWYIFVSDALNIVDYYICLPISDFNMIAINMAIIGIFLFIILYLHVRHHKKTSQ